MEKKEAAITSHIFLNGYDEKNQTVYLKFEIKLKLTVMLLSY